MPEHIFYTTSLISEMIDLYICNVYIYMYMYIHCGRHGYIVECDAEV